MLTAGKYWYFRCFPLQSMFSERGYWLNEMKMNKTRFYRVKTGFISSKTGFWLFRFFSFRFFFFDQPSKNLTLWQEFRVGPGSGMPRSEVYDAKTRKGSLKNSGSSIYFTLPSTKKLRTKSMPERRVFMLRYFNKD